MKSKPFIVACCAFLLLAGCGAQQANTDFFAMNTIMQVQTMGDDAQAAATHAEQEINRLDKQLSRIRTDSEVYALNHANGSWTTVSYETYQLIEKAKEIADWTNGAYDPTTAALTDLWGIGTDNAHVPKQEEIQAALAQVGYRNIELEASATPQEGGRVRMHNGATIDLGGIAKGYAGARALSPDDTEAALLSLGGNISAFQRDKTPYKIGVADPDDTTGYLAVVSIINGCVVTTGDYERFFEQDGVRYHHVFDPKTGYPAETDLRSATVIQPYKEGATADGLSTALFVMGLEDAQKFCNENNIPAIFVTKEKQVVLSKAMKQAARGEKYYSFVEFTGLEKGYAYEA